jgi:hypothetical protein
MLIIATVRLLLAAWQVRVARFDGTATERFPT